MQEYLIFRIVSGTARLIAYVVNQSELEQVLRSVRGEVVVEKI